jgi:ferritin
MHYAKLFNYLLQTGTTVKLELGETRVLRKTLPLENLKKLSQLSLSHERDIVFCNIVELLALVLTNRH